MRNKIKQLLKKEGGFTLVELLGVIVILGLIVGISIPLIGNVIDGAEEKTIAAQEELVIDAAQMYELGGGTLPVDSDDLIKDGYLEAKSVKDGSATVAYTVSKDATTNQYKATKK